MSNLTPENYSLLVLSALLFTALYTDISKHKIPNPLILLILITGIGLQYSISGAPGVVHSIFGIVAGFLIFMPFNILGGMRGGDLKLMSAIGAFLTFDTPIAAGLSLMAGTVFGTLILLWRGGGYDYYIRYTTMFIEASGYGRLRYQPPLAGEAAATSFPYATAITAGTMLTMIYFS